MKSDPLIGVDVVVKAILLPYLDLVNHRTTKSGGKNVYMRGNEIMVEILTSKHIPANSELFHTYQDVSELEKGSTDRGRFYSQFGFIDESMPSMLRISLALVENDKYTGVYFKEKVSFFPEATVNSAKFMARQVRFYVDSFSE